MLRACSSGTRNEKAVSNKHKTPPATYKFIPDFNNNLKKGSAGRPDWFLLSVEEQKNIKTMNNVNGCLVDMDAKVFEALHAVLQGNDTVKPQLSCLQRQPWSKITSRCTNRCTLALSATTKISKSCKTKESQMKKKETVQVRSQTQVTFKRMASLVCEIK